VLDESFGPKIEVVRKQWSGNAKNVVCGIGVLSSCVYVNPETGRFWVIDYRIFEPDTAMGRASSTTSSRRCCVALSIEGCLLRRY
jgi:hypothetical protein